MESREELKAADSDMTQKKTCPGSDIEEMRQWILESDCSPNPLDTEQIVDAASGCRLELWDHTV
jgi:hypothetical protein